MNGVRRGWRGVRMYVRRGDVGGIALGRQRVGESESGSEVCAFPQNPSLDVTGCRREWFCVLPRGCVRGDERRDDEQGMMERDAPEESETE